MTVNLAKKYESKVDDRFKLGALTGGGVNNDYTWTGVSAIEIYSIPTVDMNDYSRTGSSRYGTPSELQDTLQEMLLSKDRAFTFTIDKGNELDQMGAKDAGKALSRQINEVVIPEIDAYRLARMVAKNGHSVSASLSASNAYSSFLTAQEALNNAKVPASGRICFCTAAYYTFIKEDSNFIKGCDIAQNMLIKGQMGTIDGVPLVMAPSSYFPTGVSFILTHKSAAVAAQKLKDYITHKNPPGINGTLVEGRIIYDCFILNNKIDAIYTHYTSGTICAAPTATYVGGSTDTITLASATTGSTIKYTLDGTDPRDSTTAVSVATGSTIDTSSIAAGTVYNFRMYAYKSGNIASVVSEATVTIIST